MKNKKAFTVVELVIVIAIIAILAAVLIPTFANIIKKANTSKDNQLIRNLNTALAASRAENNNEPHANMTEALAAAEKFGYEVDKINASGTDAEILWDSQNDLFCYFDGSEIKYIPESELIYTKNNTNPEKQIYDVDYWVIRKDVTDTGAENRGEGEHQISATYSTYLAGLAGTDATIVITKGLDVGNNVSTSVQYVNDNAQRVSIRTNGGTLEVNAPNDTVNHFGDADSVNIIDVKSTSSYHEFGTVPFIQIKSGRLVLEKTADVNGIHLVVTGEGQSISFDNIVLNFGGKTVKLTRDKIGTTLGEDLMLVCKVEGENGDDEYIWLKENGTFDSKNVYVSSTPNASYATMVQEGSASYAAKAVANYLDGGVAKDSGKKAEEAEAASALKGSGTADDPFLIYDYATMQKISDFYNKGYYYFEVAIEKTNNGTIDCSGWVPVKLNGSFNGKNVRFENVDSCLFSYVNSNTEAVTINNFTATMDVFTTNTAALVYSCIGTHDVLIENVNVSGKMVSLYATSGYIGWLSSSATNNAITFKNCINDATLLSSSNTVSGFVYHAYGSKASIIVDNSLVIGTTLSPNASASSGSAFGNVHSITGQGSTTIVKVKYTQDFINNYASYLEKAFATITSKKFVCLDITAGETTISSPNYTYMCDSERNRIVTINQTTNTLPNIGQGFTGVKAAGSSFAVITLNIGPNGYNQNTNEVGTCLLGTFEEEYIDLRNIEVGGTFESKDIKMAHLALNGSVDNTGNTINGLNNGWNTIGGQLMYNDNEESNWTWIYSKYTVPNQIHTAYVQITQFDSSINALSIVRYDLFSNNVIQYTAYAN